jgi:hypothetical protein
MPVLKARAAGAPMALMRKNSELIYNNVYDSCSAGEDDDFDECEEDESYRM